MLHIDSCTVQTMWSVRAPVPSLQIPCDKTTPSPTSPKSWEESLDELSRGLQMICGSPEDLSPAGSSGYLSPGRFSPPAQPQTLSPPPIPLPHISEDKAGFSLGSMSPSQRSKRSQRTGFERSQSTSSQCTGSQRPLIVRHEESQEKLQEQLARICRTPTLGREKSLSPKAFAADFSPRATMLLRKESLKKGFRIKQDISNFNVDELVVCIHDNVHLVVYVFDGNHGNRTVLSELELPEDTQLNRLMCTVTPSNTLYIRERTSEAMDTVHEGIRHRYLPVISEDEVECTVKCILHVPEEFSYDDVHVKTVDEQLVVSAQKHRHHHSNTSSQNSPEIGPGEGKGLLCVQSSPILRMVIPLPDGVDSRSVSASVSKNNQLLITATLGSASRRYTC